MSTTTKIEVSASVEITASETAPADWLSRCTAEDFPYRMQSEADGLEHLAYNAIANGVEDASRLDGWADLDRGQVVMNVRDIETFR